MKDYIIYTDSGCDIKPELLREWGIYSSHLTFRFEDSEKEYTGEDMSSFDFDEKMRAGGVAKTAAVNSETFKERFEEILKEGKDILYLGFSSGLSTTYNSARIAAEELSQVYKENKVITVDTLCASAGEGLLLYLVVQKKNAGATIEEAAAYAKEIIPYLCHWFTVDDLVYLKRGGRISPAAAFFGNLIGIKPVLHVDDEGHLVAVSKVRGRRGAIAAMADKFGETALDKAGGTVFISHGDCLQDAQLLEKMLSDRYGAKVQIITDVGSVIGAHSGPGTLALFFVGTNR